MRYTDPTGHAYCDFIDNNNAEDCGGGLSRSQSSVSNGGRGNGRNVRNDSAESNNENCQTVTCKAFNGDVLSIIELLKPTHGGVRLQGEGSIFIISGSVGVNFLYNRIQDRLVANVDWAFEIGPGVPGLPGGISVTAGPLFGWGSSNVEDVATGSYGILSATAAGGPALSVAVTGSPIIDEKYGQVPSTVYLGGGAGCCYAGIGAGGGSTFKYDGNWIYTDISFLLPWNWSTLK